MVITLPLVGFTVSKVLPSLAGTNSLLMNRPVFTERRDELRWRRTTNGNKTRIYRMQYIQVILTPLEVVKFCKVEDMMDENALVLIVNRVRKCSMQGRAFILGKSLTLTQSQKAARVFVGMPGSPTFPLKWTRQTFGEKRKEEIQTTAEEMVSRNQHYPEL